MTKKKIPKMLDNPGKVWYNIDTIKKGETTMTNFFDTLTTILNTLDVFYTSSATDNHFYISVHEDSKDIQEAELLFDFLAARCDCETCTNYSDVLGYGTKFHFLIDGININWEWESAA